MWNTNEFDLGYAIGLIVGEGSFTYCGDRSKKYPSRARMTVKLHERDPKPLVLLKKVFGGNIYGPYHHCGRDYIIYSLSGQSLRDAIPILIAKIPPSHKRKQLIKWRKLFKPESARPRRSGWIIATKKNEKPSRMIGKNQSHWR